MTPHLLHASTVAISGKAAAITGSSGTGKSTIARNLVALGASLIADDITQIDCVDGRLWVSKPESLPALIEVHGIGLFDVPVIKGAELTMIIDMDATPCSRLPEPQTRPILDKSVALWPGAGIADLASAIWLGLTFGMPEQE